ncbi:MAG TPA: VOC family protein [Nocardioides sp.]|jgi:catechol 2,3-dioxygenase-like lactoylglutathione lyase family enzyme|uniref:VOC family protein n=1 Tax=Nocardioides sp. TaxID=35761 RepID=UPI002E3536F0|nr:VOC family protein [Nocardioides sp.]HEX3933005.1 VOC family protein [Nocardioides sp.]
MDEYPHLMHTAIDTTDCRGLAEFYRELLGLRYRPGDEVPSEGPDGADWLVLMDDEGRRKLAFQQVARLEPTTWPEHDVPMQLHVDLSVSTAAELGRQRDRALALGARVLLDRTADEDDEALYVLADPSGHPFCLLVR